MTENDSRRSLETARRKALWTLAHMHPGDARAVAVLDVLDDIEQQQELSASSADTAITVAQLLSTVHSASHPIGFRIVRVEDIPQPWRDRFLCASIGATCVPEGFCEHDWQKFVAGWEKEMRHLAEHRSARNPSVGLPR
jgi:hypothetical protein